MNETQNDHSAKSPNNALHGEQSNTEHTTSYDQPPLSEKAATREATKDPAQKDKDLQ